MSTPTWSPDRADAANRPAEAAVSSGRRPWRVLRLVGGLAMVVAMLLVASGIEALRPSESRTLGPFIDTADPGERADGLTFWAEFVKVRGSGFLADGSRTGTGTSGVFVALRAKITAKDEPISIFYAQAYDHDNVFYEPTERTRQIFQGPYQPGVPVEVDVVFEVTKQSARSLVLRLSSETTNGTHEHRLLPHVDLRTAVNADQVEAWAADKTPLKLEGRVIVP